MTIDQHGVLWFYETKKWLIAGSFDEELARYKPFHKCDKTTDELMKREQKEITKNILYGARVQIRTSKLERIKFGEIWSKLNKISLHGSYIICDTGANSDWKEYFQKEIEFWIKIERNVIKIK